MKRCVGGSGSGDSGRLEYGSVPRRNVTSPDGREGRLGVDMECTVVCS